MKIKQFVYLNELFQFSISCLLDFNWFYRQTVVFNLSMSIFFSI